MYDRGKAGARPPLYRLWIAMRNRCNNTRTPNHKYYGGRGITICAQWDDFEQFAADVGPHPGPGWTLDRIDNDGHYEPGNVQWATRQTQNRNRNFCKLDKAMADEIYTVYHTNKGKIKGRGRIGGIKQADIAKQYGISQTLVSLIIRGGAWQ